MSPSSGWSGGETTFRASAYAWASESGAANAGETPDPELRYRYGVCAEYGCADGRVTWASGLMATLEFQLTSLPPGDPANGNLTTVQLCAVRVLPGVEVVTSQACTQRDVAVVRPPHYTIFTPAVLATALQTPRLRLQAATIAAEHIAAASDDAEQSAQGSAALSKEAVLGAVLDIATAPGATSAELSTCMSVLRQLALATAPEEAPALAGMQLAIAAGAAAGLMGASNGDPAMVSALSSDVLGALSAVVVSVGGTAGSLGPDEGGEAALRQLTYALAWTSSAQLEAMPLSDIPTTTGTEDLRMLLYNGVGGGLLEEPLQLAEGGGGSDDSDELTSSGGLWGRHRRLLGLAGTDDSAGVAHRPSAALATLRAFTGLGCNNTAFNYTDDACTPAVTAVSITFVADSSYLRLGLGTAAFRAAIASGTAFPLADVDTVHTASGVLSVRGGGGPLLPVLEAQLPLDLQTGMSDLRADNKFCARVDYGAMALVVMGPARVVTVVKEQQGGRAYSVARHHALCRADAYGDYVVLQVSRAPSGPARALDYVPARRPGMADILGEPAQGGRPKRDVTLFAIAGGGLGMLLLLVAVGGWCERNGSRSIFRNMRRWQYLRPSTAVEQESRAQAPAVDKRARQPQRQMTSTTVGLQSGRAWTDGSSLSYLSRCSEVSTPPSSFVPGDRDGAHPAYSHLRHGLTLLRPGVEPSGGYERTDGRSSATATSAAALTTALHRAAATGDADEVAAALSATPGDANARDANGRSPLHAACRAGNHAAVRVLLRWAPPPGPEAAVNLNLSDTRGQTPLHLAAAHGHLPAVRALLEAVQPAELVLDHAQADDNLGGCDPAWDADASDAGNGATAEAAPRSTALDGPTIPAAGLLQANKTDGHGCSALHVAAHFGHSSVLEALLGAVGPAALWADDHQGNTALHHAAMRGHCEAVLALLRASLAAGMEDSMALAKNNAGRVPIDLATVRGHEDVVSALLLWGEQHGLNVSRPHGDGVSLMSLATFYGKRGVSRVMRRNEWWLWEEAALEEVTLEHEARRRGSAVWERVGASLQRGGSFGSSLFHASLTRIKGAVSRHHSFRSTADGVEYGRVDSLKVSDEQAGDDAELPRLHS